MTAARRSFDAPERGARDDVPPDAPVLLIRTNRRGWYAWKRTGKGLWHAGFPTLEAAVAAGAKVMSHPVRIEFVDPEPAPPRASRSLRRQIYGK